MIRVVFDTVVFVRALINPHGPCGEVVAAHSYRYRLFLSQPVVTEILEVLRLPELTRKFRHLQQISPARVIDILQQAEVVEVRDAPMASRDPKDNKFLATARAARADYLVSEDNDLLVLEDYEGTRIVSAAGFLDVLRQGAEG